MFASRSSILNETVRNNWKRKTMAITRILRLFARAAGLMAIATQPLCAQSFSIEGGQIEGKTLPSGVRGWFGVPFAAPPLSELRWRAPQPVAPWRGIIHADRFPPECLQALRNRTMNHYFGDEATSEDCLYLNIWAPAAPAPAGHPYPVLVWIYGGGFTVGSASMANYAGVRTAEKGVIQVNLAYRLGVLGFFSHPELSKEGGDASGNYGLMDQIAALHWVQRNIGTFGGDPARVTIVGQSAGSFSVALLQASPTAKGLFRAAVGMSGAPFGDTLAAEPLKQAEADGVVFQQSLKAAGIEALRDLPGDRVITAPIARQSPITIDGKVLTEAPAQAFAAHRQSDVPIMIGFTHDEGFASLGPVKSVAEYRAAVSARFPANAAAILSAYPATSDTEAVAQARIIARDMSVGSQMAHWAHAQHANGTSPAYVWLFTRRQPYAPGITFSDHDPATVGAYHTGDVPYWLRTQDALNLFRNTRDWGVADRALGEEMSDMLVSFVKTGAPSADWPVFDPRHPRVMQLGLETRAIDWPNYAALDLLAAPVKHSAPAAAARPRD
jgi:para-nitrobenzyl esterase